MAEKEESSNQVSTFHFDVVFVNVIVDVDDYVDIDGVVVVHIDVHVDVVVGVVVVDVVVYG
jgi:hypothetical protein